MTTKKQKPSKEEEEEDKEIQRLKIAECFFAFEICAICALALINLVLLFRLDSRPPFWPFLTGCLIPLLKIFLGPIDSWNQTFLPYFNGFWDELGEQTTNFLVQRCLAAISILLLSGAGEADMSVVTALLSVLLVPGIVMYCLLYMDFDEKSEDIDSSESSYNSEEKKDLGVEYEDTANNYGNDEKIRAGEGVVITPKSEGNSYDNDRSEDGFELIDEEEEEYQRLEEKLKDLGDEFVEFIQKYLKSSAKGHLVKKLINANLLLQKSLALRVKECLSLEIRQLESLHASF